MIKQWFRTRFVVTALITIGAFCVVAGARQSGVLEGLEFIAYDWMLRSQPRLVLDNNPVVLIKIREDEIQRYGHPLCDKRLALALTKLLAHDPRGVGVDIYRDHPIELCGGKTGEAGLTAEDTDLADAATRTDLVVMIAKPLDQPPIAAPAFLEFTNQIAVPDFPIDRNGTLRRSLLLMSAGDQTYLSLSLQLAIRYLSAEGIELQEDPDSPGDIRLGETTIPPFQSNDGSYIDADSGGYQFVIDFALGHEGFPNYSLDDLYAGKIPDDAIRDKVVLIGTESVTVKDEFFTPLSAGLENPMLTGLEAHAHMISQLIRFAHGNARPLQSYHESLEIAWIALWCVLGAALGLWNRALSLTLALGLLGVGGLSLFSYQQLATAVWIPFVPPLMGFLSTAGLVTAYLAVVERAERGEVAGLFSRFLRPEVAELIWEKRSEFLGDDGRPRSQRITLTSLMSDLQGYTTASESMDPEALMSWINEYMNIMADLVGDYGGVVDDYAGDGIKANFGFPLTSVTDDEIGSDARNAVLCALAMGRAMGELNESWRKRGMPVGRVRVGIYTGPAVVGILGGGKSMKYTTVGDTVNTAARLESFAKAEFSAEEDRTDWRVLIGDGTMERLDGGFVTQDIGSHALKGKHEEIRIYRVLRSSEGADVAPPG